MYYNGHEIRAGSTNLNSVLMLMFHSNSCMLGQKWVWPRSDCISVTSMAQNVLTVVWPEIPTAPGMVLPAPDTILLESTTRGNSTHAPHDKTPFSPCRCVSALSLHTNRHTSVPSHHLALNVTRLWGCFIKAISRLQGTWQPFVM